MRHVAGGNMRAGGFTVGLLIIKKDIGLVSAEEVGFIEPAEEDGLVDTNVPCPQRTDDPLVRRR